MTSVND